MQLNKLDVKEYEEAMEIIRESIKIMKMGLKDNFSQLLATDNYLEKYLPFKIQNMISNNILCFLDPRSIKKSELMTSPFMKLKAKSGEGS